MSHNHKQCIQNAKEWAKGHPDVIGVYDGLRHKGADQTLTDENCVVVVVRKKRPQSELTSAELVPQTFGALRTDVIEVKDGYKAQAFTQRRRPAESGIGCGHEDITVGTLGAWVHVGPTDEWFGLTNNHVAAKSNDATIGDPILQPGAHDGGSFPGDVLGELHDFVEINFGSGGDTPIPDIPCPMASRFDAVSNWALKQIGSRYRVTSAIPGAQTAQQPNPNRVDVAVFKPLRQSDVNPTMYQLGDLNGIRDLVLGDLVQKHGRTTQHTRGRVVGIDGEVQVNYGSGRTAIFDGQVIIEGLDGAEFSAGGDSGSAIITMDNFIGALLYAGGGGQTIGNRISDVVAYQGIRLN